MFIQQAVEKVKVKDFFNSHPSITWYKSDYCVAWLASDGSKDNIYWKWGKESPSIVAQSQEIQNYLYKPQVIVNNEKILIFWIEKKANAWQIKNRELMQKNAVNKVLLESKHPLQDLKVVDGQNESVWLVWTEIVEKGSYIYASKFNGKFLSPSLISKGLEASYSPSIALNPLSDQVGVTWYSFHRGKYQIFWRSYSKKQWSPTLQVSTGNIFNYYPSITFDGNGEIWIAWNRNIDKIDSDPRIANNTAYFPLESQEAYNQHICWYHRKRVIVKNIKRDRVYQLGIEFSRNIHWPKIITDGDNRVWMFVRSETSRGRYDVQTYVFFENKWNGPILFGEGRNNGQNYKVDVAIRENEMCAAWEGDDRENLPRGVPVENSWINIYKTKIESLLQQIDAEGTAEYLMLENEELQRGIKSKGPAVISDKQGEYYLFFGNTHVHTEYSPCYSGANQSIDFNYRHSRDIMQNDFTVITDHAEFLSVFDWRELHKVASIYNQPGFYVAFPGYEYTGSLFSKHVRGHAHVINRVDHLPYYGDNNPDTNTMVKLWEKLDPERSMCIPHHTADQGWPYNWENQFNSRYTPVVEIYQDVRGSCEYRDCPGTTGYPQTEEEGHYVQDALMQGYRFGIIASSDHFGIARAAVYAQELTRDAIFDALKKRRCYGTTGAKIYLYFAINDQIMGSEIKYTSDLTLKLKVQGMASLQEVTIFRNNCVLFCFHPGEIHFQTVVKFEQKSKDCFYYVRVIQTDKEMAWSSPIWVSTNDKNKSEYSSCS